VLFHDAFDSDETAFSNDLLVFTLGLRLGFVNKVEVIVECLLSWKMLRRYLAMDTAVEFFNVKDLFRQAGRQGIIDNVESWFAYLEGRNLTSHTYNEKTSEETSVGDGLSRRCTDSGRRIEATL
jgi:nucleotidyltransferase substrate binding protein (TIGR01987 family)